MCKTVVRSALPFFFLLLLILLFFFFFFFFWHDIPAIVFVQKLRSVQKVCRLLA